MLRIAPTKNASGIYKAKPTEALSNTLPKSILLPSKNGNPGMQARREMSKMLRRSDNE